MEFLNRVKLRPLFAEYVLPLGCVPTAACKYGYIKCVTLSPTVWSHCVGNACGQAVEGLGCTAIMDFLGEAELFWWYIKRFNAVQLEKQSS